MPDLGLTERQSDFCNQGKRVTARGVDVKLWIQWSAEEGFPDLWSTHSFSLDP